MRHWSSTQTTIALSSGEAELGGMAKGISHGLGLRSIASDLGIPLHLKLRTNATAVMGMSRRPGVWKIRHLDTALLWARDKIRSGEVILEKAPGNENPVDAITMYLPSQDMSAHRQRMGRVLEDGRPMSAPQLATSVLQAMASHRAAVRTRKRRSPCVTSRTKRCQCC